MATFSRNHNQSPVPDLPEFDELEARCTWSGEYEQLADLRVSLEVRCVPNTQLQLLNVRDHEIYLGNAFAVCLSQDEDRMNNQQEDEAPQSPLFGFSSLAVEGDNDIGPRPVVENSADSVHALKASPIPNDNDEILECIGSSQQDTELHDEEPSLLGNPAPPVRSPRSSLHAPGLQPLTKSLKRTATDAELPDSDNDDEVGGVLREITPRNRRQTSLVKSTVVERTSKRTIACPTSPRKSELQKRSGSVVSNENGYPLSPIKPTAAGATSSEMLMSPGILATEGQASRKSNKILNPTFTQESTPLRSSAPTTSIDDTARSQDQSISQSYVAPSDAVLTRPIMEPVQASKTMFTVTTISKRSGEHHLSSTSAIAVGTVEEPELCSKDPELHYTPRSSEDPHHNHSVAEEPEPSDQPEVRLVDGLIILVNSEKVYPATFKITVTVSIHIPFPNEEGWSDMIVPGLPRTENGKHGFFLFLMPSRHGLELQTTNVKRAKLVENCFIAEFVNSGDLVVPMRRCDRRYCGDVTGFTVEQEVAHSVVKTTANYQSGWENFELRFTVMFSVRLHNRCFWTDRCSILLYVEGGPEGSYRCDLSPQNGGLKEIHIPASEYAEIGVCHVHVTCSPRDLEKLCLTWVSSGTGREAAYWVPRISSTSSATRERTRDALRHGTSTSLFSNARAGRFRFTNRSEFSRGNDPIKLTIENAKDHTEDSSFMRSVSTGQKISPGGRAIQVQLIGFAQDPKYILKWTLVGLLCLVFLETKAFTFTRPIHHCPGLTPSVAQVGLEVPEQAIPIPQLDLSGEYESSGHEEAQGRSATGLNELKMLNTYRAVDIDSTQSEASVEAKREPDKPNKGVSAEGDVNEASSNSIRDRIDYWLGWTGPIE
ncbi:hypothetical protein BJX63DRAFT_427301 [Aspergillus granulosus]|uniref:Uncharacterized protein n=1 Tax=Aspergillus granulosus TaxID=176169 RepID=A0ABR4I4M9_9EURO